MPRIGVALEVVAVVAACIAFNVVRYPAVGQMLKGEPPAAAKVEPAAASAAVTTSLAASSPPAARAELPKEPAPPAAKPATAMGIAAAVVAAPKPQPAVAAEKYAHAASAPPPQAQTAQTSPPEIRRPLEPVVWPKATPAEPGKTEKSAEQTHAAQLVGLSSPTEPGFCLLPPVEHTAPINPAALCGPDGAIPFYPSTGL